MCGIQGSTRNFAELHLFTVDHSFGVTDGYIRMAASPVVLWSVEVRHLTDGKEDVHHGHHRRARVGNTGRACLPPIDGLLSCVSCRGKCVMTKWSRLGNKDGKQRICQYAGEELYRRLLFCWYCAKAIDHHRKSTLDDHIKGNSHRKNVEKAKGGPMEMVEAANCRNSSDSKGS